MISVFCFRYSILSFLFIIFSVEIVCALNCCAENTFIVRLGHCQNGSKANLSCPKTEDTTLLYNSNLFPFQFGKDEEGEYMESYRDGFIVRDPFFCKGTMKGHSDVVIICVTRRIMYEDLNEDLVEVPLSDRIYSFFYMTFHGLSAFSFLLTVLVYASIQELQDTHGICILHLSICSAIHHAIFFYKMIFETDTLLPNFCITSLYIENYGLLARFIWSSIMSYNCWACIKYDNLQKDNKVTMYKFIGYGIPAVNVLICNLIAHGTKLYTSFRFERECTSHQGVVIVLFGELPILICLVINCFFYFATFKLSLNSSTFDKTQFKSSTLKKLKYRLILNGKLFVITGIPWFLVIIFNGLYLYFEIAFSWVLISLLLASAEGMLIFFITVIKRKRVYKIISHNLGTNYCSATTQWKQIVDSETDDEDECNEGLQQRVEFEREKDDGVFQATVT